MWETQRIEWNDRKKSESFKRFERELMGLIGAGNNPMVGMTVAVAVAIEEASK